MYLSSDDRLTAYFSEDFSGFTGGGDFLVKDREEWVAITCQDFDQIRDPTHVELKDLAIQLLADTIAVATGFFSIQLPIEDQALSRKLVRLVLIFRRESSDWKVSHISMSIPYDTVCGGEVYPPKELLVSNQLLEELVAQKTIQLSEANRRLQKVNEELMRQVAEHKQIEQALLESEGHYRQLAEDASDVVWRLDSDYRFTYVNAADERLRGYTADEVIGHHVFELFNEEGIASVKKLAKQRQEAEQHGTKTGTRTFEAQHRCKDGRWVWGEIRLTPDRDAHGTITGFFGITREITERRRMNEELYAREQAFRSLAENTRDLIFRYDRNCRRTYVNPAVVRFFDKTAETLLGKTPDELMVLDLDNNSKHMRCIREVLKSSRSMECGLSIVGPDGLLNHFLCGYAPEYGHDGNVESVMATAKNITERKKIEIELKLNERRLLSLHEISQYPYLDETDFFDHALNEIINIAESKIGHIFSYNEQKRQFTLASWSKDAMKECQILEQKTIYDLDSVGIWGEAVRQKKPIVVNDLEASNLLKKGYPEGHVAITRFLSIPVIANGAIVAVVGVANKKSDYSHADVMQLTLFMDSVWKIVDRKRMEEANLKLEKQLLHTQKLESLGVLAGGIAHDFNNILTVMIGNADLGLMKISPESPVTDNLHKIKQAAFRAADLSKQMLAYSGKGQFVIEHTDLNCVLEEMLHMLEVSISKKIALRLELNRPLQPVEADITQIQQVIMNLIINASEAIGDDNGVITITTQDVICDKNYLNNIAPSENLPEGNYVVLMVADTGCGMDQDTIAKIFDPFFTTKFTGRGLGMSALQGIIKGHKGAINIYSEPGKGSIFKIFLPASVTPVPNLTVNPNNTEWHGNGTVLLVDDEEEIRNLGSEILKMLGFEAITANDGYHALEILKRNQSITTVILDLTMPRMDGEQTFSELRKLDPDIKIIMSSGYNEQEVTQKFIGKGLAGFIQKPYRASSLREVFASINC
jgi:PAS domain S-box-containing protein